MRCLMTGELIEVEQPAQFVHFLLVVNHWKKECVVSDFHSPTLSLDDE